MEFVVWDKKAGKSAKKLQILKDIYFDRGILCKLPHNWRSLLASGCFWTNFNCNKLLPDPQLELRPPALRVSVLDTANILLFRHV